MLRLRTAVVAAGVVAVLISASLGSAATASAHRRIVLGRSVEGRPIVAYRVGNPSSTHRELVIGCVHGNESAGVAIARLLRDMSPTNVDLWVVPTLNPDGMTAGTRQNAHGVDLNRNFPYRWARSSRGLFYSGPRPLSEPESRIGYRLIRKLRPQVSIWYHQHANLVDESGGKVSIERRFARLVGMRLERMTRYPGSAVGWSNHVIQGGTAFVVELPAGRLTRADAQRFANASVAVGTG